MMEKSTLLNQDMLQELALPSVEELQGKSSTCPEADKPSDKKKKNRCAMKGCKKKLTLMAYTCQCDKKYCALHRMPEDHNCSFDYVEHGRKLIAKKNPQIVADKINKI